MATHELKAWPEFFDAIIAGRKLFEMRLDDRGYRVGDVLRLRRWCPDRLEYTGEALEVDVTYLMRTGVRVAGDLAPGWVVMSVSPRIAGKDIDHARASRFAAAAAGGHLNEPFNDLDERTHLARAYLQLSGRLRELAALEIGVVLVATDATGASASAVRETARSRLRDYVGEIPLPATHALEARVAAAEARAEEAERERDAAKDEMERLRRVASSLDEIPVMEDPHEAPYETCIYVYPSPPEGWRVGFSFSGETFADTEGEAVQFAREYVAELRGEAK